MFNNFLNRTAGLDQFNAQFGTPGINPAAAPMPQNPAPQQALSQIAQNAQNAPTQGGGGGGGSFIGDLLSATNVGRAMDGVSQRRALKELAEQMQTGQVDPEDAALKYAGITGDYSALFGAGSKAPSSIQEWNTFNNMPEEDQRRYLQMKRSNQMFDRGGSQVVLDPTGQQVVEIDKTLAPEQLPQTKYDQTASVAQAKIDTDNLASSGKLEDQATLMLKTIDSILEDEEGLEASTGGFLGMKGRASSATGGLSEAQRRFQPKIDQLKGQTFLNAYERLKGGGVITEIEGEKAEAALARLNQAQDPEDYREALADIRDVVSVGLKRSAKQAQSQDPLTASRNAIQQRNAEGIQNEYQTMPPEPVDYTDFFKE